MPVARRPSTRAHASRAARVMRAAYVSGPDARRPGVHLPRQTGSIMSTSQSTSDNPLLDFSDLPRFGEIRPEHVTPALDVLLANATSAVERAAAPSTPASWADVVEPVDCATAPRSRSRREIGRVKA